MTTRLGALLRHLNRAKITTASGSSAVHNTNEACCTIPPVQTDHYKPKGTFESLGGFKKVYVTGPSNSDNAIICVYDIFGYVPQTQQGADLIASTLRTRVYMPDFFEPNGPFLISKHPPKTDEDKPEFQAFFGGTANISAAIAKLKSFGETLRADGTKRVGVYGFCWGGKVTVSAAGESTPFDAVSIIHPALLSANDVSKLTVPLGIYISKDEPVNEYNKIVDIISKKPFAAKNDHKYYENMFHGWAAARANLKDEANQKGFEDVYRRLADFFQKALV